MTFYYPKGVPYKVFGVVLFYVGQVAVPMQITWIPKRSLGSRRIRGKLNY